MEEITNNANQQELILRALQTSADRKRREELTGTQKTSKQTTKQANYLKTLQSETSMTRKREEKKQSSSENTIDNHTVTTVSKKPHDKAILVWNKKSRGTFVHNHFVKQKFEDLPENVRKSLESSHGTFKSVFKNQHKSCDQTRNSQKLNVKVDLNQKFKLKNKNAINSQNNLFNPMNTENVSPRHTQKAIDRQEIRSYVDQRRPESATSISVQFGQKNYFLDPKKSMPVGNELQLEVARQSTLTQAQRHQKYRLTTRLSQSIDRLTKPIGSTVRLKSAFNQARSSLKIQDSELGTKKGSLMQSIDGQRIPVKKTASNHLVLKKQFLYNDPQFYRVKFAQPALYKTGCLTCGRENVSVQNYGERYICVNCQKSIQTPNGESVTLKPSSDYRRIVAQAWKNNVLLKGIKVNIDDMRIFGYKCHATFAGEKGELIVLLDES